MTKPTSLAVSITHSARQGQQAIFAAGMMMVTVIAVIGFFLLKNEYSGYVSEKAITSNSGAIIPVALVFLVVIGSIILLAGYARVRARR